MDYRRDGLSRSIATQVYRVMPLDSMTLHGLHLGTVSIDPSFAQPHTPCSVYLDSRLLPPAPHCHSSKPVPVATAPEQQGPPWPPPPAAPVLPGQMQRGSPRQCARPSSRSPLLSDGVRRPNRVPCPAQRASGRGSWNRDRMRNYGFFFFFLKVSSWQALGKLLGKPLGFGVIQYRWKLHFFSGSHNKQNSHNQHERIKKKGNFISSTKLTNCVACDSVSTR